MKKAILVAAALGLTACGTNAIAGGTGHNPDPATVRLGYLANLTHAPALIGVHNGFLASSLPAGTSLATTTFGAGPAESEALLGGSLDAAFVGPSPAIKAFTSTRGGVVIVAGAVSGGAGLVVSPSIADGDFPRDLRGITLATPQLGNTQDVALRYWLSRNGLSTDINGGGDVTVDASSGNSVSLQKFRAHQIAGAWMPEPWASQFVLTAGGRLVVDESSLWPGGNFPTTELVVTRSLLTEHADIVGDLLAGLVKTERWIGQNPSQAAGIANAALAQASGSKPLPANVLALAWSHLTFTLDPLGAALRLDAAHAQQVGLLGNVSLQGVVDIRPLDAALAAAGSPAIGDGGLGP